MVVAWGNGDLLGYAPFMETIESLGPWTIPVLRFIGNNIGYPGDILYADIVAASPEVPVLEAILHHVRASWRVSKWDLGFLNPRSASFGIACRVLTLDAHTVRVLPHQDYVTLQSPDTWEAFLGGVSPKARNNFRRSLRQLEAQGVLLMKIDRDSSGASRRVEELIRNHERWWTGTKRNEWFGGAAARRFLVQAAGLLGEQNRYLAFTLELDGTPIAWSAGAFDRGRYYEQIVSYDHTHSSASPGMILSFLLVRELLSRKVRRVELGPGLDRRKRSLGGVAAPFVRTQDYVGWVRRAVRIWRRWTGRRRSS